MNKSKTGFYQRLIAHVVIWGAFAGYMLALSGFFFSPLKWPIGGVFNIGFVYAWIVVFVLAIAHLFIHKPTSIVFLVFLALGSIPFSNSFSVKTSGSFSEKKIQESIRIMQWNCEDLGGNLSWYTEEVIGRKRAEGFIKKFEPDIICLQDYSESRGKIYKSNNAFLKDTLGYAYSADALQSVQIKKYGVIRSGLKIVSKYPISAQGIIYYKGLTFPEAILWADVTVNEMKLRVVTTHFRSFYLNADKAFIQYMPTSLKEDAQVIEGKNIFKKLAYFQKQQALQASQLRSFLDSCSVPVVFAADLNSVPSGYLYKKVKGKMIDGFIGNETGLGATFNYLLPNIRIDYLMHGKEITLLQWKHFEDGFFDHDHLLGDYSLSSAN